jgi:hypothetical protein
VRQRTRTRKPMRRGESTYGIGWLTPSAGNDRRLPADVR